MDHKSSPVKLTKTEIVSRIFFWPQCYEIRNQLQEEKKKQTTKNTNTWRLNNKLITTRSLEKSKKISESIQMQMTIKTRWPKSYGRQQQRFSEGKSQEYNPTSRNLKNFKPFQTFTNFKTLQAALKQPKNEDQTKLKVSRRKEIIKISRNKWNIN